MTELLIDVGNSRCKYACVEDRRIKLRGAFALDNPGEIAKVVQKCGTAMPEASYMMSVASRSTNDSIAAAVVQQLGHTPILLDKKMPLGGLRSNYEAAQLGIDRVAVMLAAWQRLRRACIVIDCGTAVTVDFIDDEGLHRGGVILPSDQLMRDSLSHGTAQLDHFGEAHQHLHIFATNTEDAVVFGCRLTLIASLSKIVQEMCRQINRDVAVLATGGGADMLENTATYRAANVASIKQLSVIPTLSFEGMMVIIEECI